MPIIGPPSDSIYPVFESEINTQNTNTAWEEYRRVALYLDCKPWVCSCGLTNFGRNRNCAKWECKKPRPSDWRPK